MYSNSGDSSKDDEEELFLDEFVPGESTAITILKDYYYSTDVLPRVKREIKSITYKAHVRMGDSSPTSGLSALFSQQDHFTSLLLDRCNHFLNAVSDASVGALLLGGRMVGWVWPRVIGELASKS